LDLTNQSEVKKFFKDYSPDYVLLAAAKVGGIKANMQDPVAFLYENLMIQSNVINYAYQYHTKKLLFLGSSCIYPTGCPQPMKEEYLLTGSLEPTNEGYALAKIVGLKLLQYHQKQYGHNGSCVMPCNLYGPNDSFDPENSHVLSALIKKFMDAVKNQFQEITLWGTGNARREFLHVDDLARACLMLMNQENSFDLINIGSGQDLSICELANIIAAKVNYTGKIIWDTSMPDGMMRKCLDISKINKLGFIPLIPLDLGIDDLISEYNKIAN